MGNKLKLNKCSAKPPSVLDSKISATPTSMSATPSSSTSPSTVSPMEPKKNTPSDKTSSANTVEYAKINADKNNTFTVGHNFMSTWTAEEYKKLLGYKGPKEQTFDGAQSPEPTILSEVGLPDAKDW